MLLIFKIFILCAYMSSCMYVIIPCVCLVHKEAMKEILWKWSYRWLLAMVYILGTQSESSEKQRMHLITKQSFQNYFRINF